MTMLTTTTTMMIIITEVQQDLNVNVKDIITIIGVNKLVNWKAASPGLIQGF